MPLSSMQSVASQNLVCLPEAEVTLRLAFWLMEHAEPGARINAAIDGAHVRIAPHKQAGREIPERIVFPIEAFLSENGYQQITSNGNWRGIYRRNGRELEIQSVSGFDITAKVKNKTIKVECKGYRKKNVSFILATAIGQILISDPINPGDELWVAVPDTNAYKKAADKLAQRSTFSKTGIRIALVAQDGKVTFPNGYPAYL